MKKFAFSMQKILDLREFEKQQAELELGKANAEVSRIRGELGSIAASRAATINAYNTDTDLKVQSTIQSYFFLLDRRKEKLLEELERAEHAASEKREKVRLAMQRVKVLENLKDSKLKAWKKALLKEEDRATDDIVTAKTNKRLAL